jgi:3-methylcrotonyl-CoA carboxylase alpha subunit
MKYRLKVGEDISELHVVKSENPDALRFVAGDAEHDITFRVLDGNRYQLTVGGKSTEALVVRGNRGKHVVVKGRSFFVQDADELPQHRAGAGRDEDLPGEVTPPMPAVVVRILVKEGDRVKKGQGLLVVTAMKMETTLAAPKDGIVKRINTSVHAKVAPGDILVEVEAENHD